MNHEHFYSSITSTTYTKVKIAGFDIDGTIITPKRTCELFGKYNDPNDFTFKFKKIPKCLNIISKDFKIIFFTNQGGIEKGDQSLQLMIDKLENIKSEIGLRNISYCIAKTRNEHYRKPGIGMWEYVESVYKNIDKRNSFFVGDSAGRPCEPCKKCIRSNCEEVFEQGRPTDYGDFDKQFAKNIGIKFYTPEDFFYRKMANVNL
uniref:D,D-heptose 1,7-bisphosphate phosphatase n=1 Tax=viral metagenome TaxID=1070528 RepID=A0A6C0JSN1_9ZZZZ